MNLDVEKFDFEKFYREKYVVPFNQRSYIWGETQLNAFWDDLVHVESNRSRHELHFLGSIVAHKSFNNNFIIDGQQRVTTFNLMYIALFSMAMKLINEREGIVQGGMSGEEYRRLSRETSDYRQAFWNQLKMIFEYDEYPSDGGSARWALRFRPSLRDQGAYNSLLEYIEESMSTVKLERFNILSEVVDSDSNILVNYKKIEKKIRDMFLTLRDSNEKLGKLMLYMEQLAKGFIFCVVTVENGDPTEIFDNLNTMGERLSKLDVIRNSAFQGIISEDLNETNTINKLWLGFEKAFIKSFNETLAEDDSNKAKKQLDYINAYWQPFAHALCNTAITNKNLISEINFAIDDLFDNSELEDKPSERAKFKIKQLGKYSDIYNALRINKYAGDAENLPKELKYELNTFYRLKCPTMVFSYIFQAVDYYVTLGNEQHEVKTKKDIIDSFKEVQTRIMRDTFSLSDRQAPKDIYLPLFKKIKDHGYNFRLVRYFLVTKQLPYPTDSQLKEDFETKEYFGTERMRYFLEEFEIEKRSYTPLQIEEFLTQQYRDLKNPVYEKDHLMPVDGRNWKENLTQEYSKKEYSELVNKIGNIFLLEKTTNIQKGNKSFEDSKQIIGDQTVYGEFISTLEKWDESDIRDRCRAYYDFFIKRWPNKEDHETPSDPSNDLPKEKIESMKQKFNQYLEEDIKVVFQYLSQNSWERNDQNLIKDLKEMAESIQTLATTRTNKITLKLVGNDAVINELVISAYEGRANDINREEWKYSIENLQQLFSPGDVLMFYVKDNSLYCINLSNSYTSTIENQLKA